MQTIAQLFAGLSEEKRAQVLAQLSDAEVRQLGIATEGLLEFIPRVSPELVAPRHLQPLVNAVESTLDRPRYLVVSTPPQHGKTTVCLHGLMWLAQQNPKLRHAYVTYESSRANIVSEETRRIADRAGIGWKGNIRHWRFAGGGSVFATAVDSALTGNPVDGLLLVDDPHKNRAEAESATYRQRADDWFRSVALTRMHPSASVIVVATRWHPDDLIGRLLDRGWESIILPAINEKGEALWPEQRPLAFLEDKRERVGEYEWASLFQCVPRARGAAVFGDAHLVDSIATMNLTGYRVALGIDSAYSAKKYADYSVAVVMAEVDGKFYVLEVDRGQWKTPVFNERIKALKKKWAIHKSRWYTNTTEIGVSDLLDVRAVVAKEDKFTRSQPVAAAWNAGKVLVPSDGPWTNQFVSEVVSFTGVDDAHDDQVDALAAAFDALKTGASYEGWGSTEMPKRRI